MTKYLLAVSAAALVVAGAAFLLLQTGSATANQDLHYVPNDALMIASVRVDEVIKSQAYKDLIAELTKSDPKNADPDKEFQPDMGVSIKDVVRITAGASEKPDGKVMVLTTSKAMTAGDLQGKMKRRNFAVDGEKWEPRKFTEIKVGSHTLYEEEGGGGQAFCVAGPNTVVYGKSSQLKSILERNQKAELTAGMKSALDLANQRRTFFVAINGKGAPTKDLPLDQLGPAAGLVDKVEAVAIDGNIAADAEVSVVANCKEAKDAEEIKKSVEGLVLIGKTFAAGKLPADVTKPLDDLKIENKGNQVLARTSVKPAALMVAMMGMQSKAAFDKVEEGVIPPPPAK